MIFCTYKKKVRASHCSGVTSILTKSMITLCGEMKVRIMMVMKHEQNRLKETVSEETVSK